MDIISQLQEQVNSIAAIAFNAFGTPFPEQPKQLSAGLVKAAKQVENDTVGQELQKHLEAEKELKQVQELFGQAADNCLNMKKHE